MYSIYTDGATSGNGYEGAQGGWAWILLDGNGKCIHGQTGQIINATNNICELKAVIEGCKMFLAHTAAKKEDTDCTIYTDSAYIINCYKDKWYKKWQANGWINSKRQPVANKELWEKLIPYFENPKIHFEKVAGHSGNKYNETVDKMAVAAKNKKSWGEYFWKLVDEKEGD